MTLTEIACCPGEPEFGVSVVIAGVAAVTLNPFKRVANSVPVVTVTVCEPTVAVDAMLMTAVAAVGELTVSDATVIPAPNEVVVVPCTK